MKYSKPELNSDCWQTATVSLDDSYLGKTLDVWTPFLMAKVTTLSSYSTRSRYIHDLRIGRGLIRADYWQILLRQPATRLSLWPLVHPVTCTLEGIWGFVSVQHLTLNFISISCSDYKLWPIFWGSVQCSWLILSALASWLFTRLRYVLKSSNVHHIERGTSHKDYAKDCFTLNVDWEHLQWALLIVSAFVLASTRLQHGLKSSTVHHIETYITLLIKRWRNKDSLSSLMLIWLSLTTMELKRNLQCCFM